MSRRSTKLLKAALAAVHYSGAESFLGPLTKGVGVIFMLHQVRPDPPQEFEPNRILKRDARLSRRRGGRDAASAAST